MLMRIVAIDRNKVTSGAVTVPLAETAEMIFRPAENCDYLVDPAKPLTSVKPFVAGKGN